MAVKFKTLKGKWISIESETEPQLLNLDSFSKIRQTSEFYGEYMTYLIAFTPKSPAEEERSEWCFEYNNEDDWNADFDELKDILKQSNEV